MKAKCPQRCTKLVLWLSLGLLAACDLMPVRDSMCAPCPPCPSGEVVKPPPAKALQPASWSDLPGWQDEEVTAAWPAFLQSCRALAPKAAVWKRVCGEAAAVEGKNASAVRQFFEAHFLPHAAIQPDGKPEGMITGYYEPLLNGSRTPGKAGKYPVYGVPDDLLTIDLGEIWPELKHLRLRGRLSGNKVVPYYSRREIEDNRAPRLGKPLLWVEDKLELFFLQVQGSGRVRLPDGKLVRIGYADQNGQAYHSIGRVLIERGELKPGEASMQGIQAWARANPGKLQEILNANPSYVFFRELPDSGDGPPGALGVPLTAERSLAIDPRYIPLGAPVYLATTYPNSSRPLNRLMLAQDTGGAIKGVVRADFFWGFGAKAGEEAGRMKQSGKMWVLLPKDAGTY